MFFDVVTQSRQHKHNTQQGGTAAGKAEIKKIPIVGDIAKACQTVFIDRHSSGGRKAALDAIVNRAKDKKLPPVV